MIRDKVSVGFEEGQGISWFRGMNGSQLAVSADRVAHFLTVQVV